MAIAGGGWPAISNRPGFDMFDYDVYALAGDGCMMEGVSSEAASLAGHLRLANLCWVYDNNKITIEGHTEWAFSEDVATRFIAYGWNVTRVGDANDLEMLERAFKTFRATRDRPTLVIVDSHIAWGAPNKQDTHAAHGEPLGDEEIRLTKRNYGWPEDARFLVPTACASTSPRCGGARAGGARGVDGDVRALPGRPSRARRPPLQDAAPAAPRWLGQGPRALPRRRQGCGRPRCLGQGAQHPRPEHAVAHRRRRRPRALDEDAPDLRGRG